MSNPSDSDLAKARELLRVYGLRGHDADGSDWITGIAAALRAEREAVWREARELLSEHAVHFDYDRQLFVCSMCNAFEHWQCVPHCDTCPAYATAAAEQEPRHLPACQPIERARGGTYAGCMPGCPVAAIANATAEQDPDRG